MFTECNKIDQPGTVDHGDSFYPLESNEPCFQCVCDDGELKCDYRECDDCQQDDDSLCCKQCAGANTGPEDVIEVRVWIFLEYPTWINAHNNFIALLNTL